MVIVVQARVNAGVTDDVKVTVTTNNEQITITDDEEVTMTTDDNDTLTTYNGNGGQATMTITNEHTTMTDVSNDNSSDDSSEDDVEMKQLLSEEKATTNTSHRSHVRQILTRLPWLVIAIIILLVGIVLSQYHLHPSYQSSCSNDTEPVINVTSRQQYLLY